MSRKWVKGAAVAGCFSVSLVCCGGGSEVGNFASPEEFLEDPTIAGAVEQTGQAINPGDNPPSIIGRYSVLGEVLNASDPGKIGESMSLAVCLYNQTLFGKIDYAEKQGDASNQSTGNHLTGEGENFTIWMESKNSAGYCWQHRALLLSGTRLPNGDLEGTVLAVVLKSHFCGRIEAGYWEQIGLTFKLDGECSGLSDL